MKILIVAKQSKYEWERQKLGLTHEQICAKYSEEHANLEAILKSHEAQLESRKKLKELLPEADIITMDKLKAPVKGYDLVISFGGDNSFSYTSHFVNSTPIMGINSDPGRSLGALNAWSANDLEAIAQKINAGDYKLEEWPRLEAEIDGRKIMPATSEYFFGENRRKDMTRYVLVYRGKEYEQKNSGLIIATGAGSTGWYESAARYIYPRGNRFAKTEKKAVFVASEPFMYNGSAEDNALTGEILLGEEIVIYSLNDSEGYASVDSWENYEFPRGRKAVVRLSEKPLKVVVPR